MEEFEYTRSGHLVKAVEGFLTFLGTSDPESDGHDDEHRDRIAGLSSCAYEVRKEQLSTTRASEDRWLDISTAPKDEIILLAYDNQVAAGWWGKDALYPWEFVDNTEHYLDEHMENDPGVIQVNGWPEHSPTHWMPLPPKPPLPAFEEK